MKDGSHSTEDVNTTPNLVKKAQNLSILTSLWFTRFHSIFYRLNFEKFLKTDSLKGRGLSKVKIFIDFSGTTQKILVSLHVR